MSKMRVQKVIPCVVCGKSFASIRKPHIYCSRPCGDRAQRNDMNAFRLQKALVSA
jgi:predicted nucleic acid-binding Zn ribbon protein